MRDHSESRRPFPSAQGAIGGKVAGSTIVSIETRADGNAAYEARLIRSDGTRATVYVDKQFNVVSTQPG